jgi:hypothetical protein
MTSCRGLRRFMGAMLMALPMALTMSPPAALAHDQAPTQASAEVIRRADALTQALLKISSSSFVQPDQTLLATVATRRQLLLALMETAPQEVLRLAIPQSIRANLPTQIRAQLEEEVTVEGRLEIFHEDTPRGGRYEYGVQTASGRYTLHFADPPADLLTGAWVRVRGMRVDSRLALAGGRNMQTTSAAPAQSTIGEQRTLVMLVNFADNPARPWSRDQATQAIFGTMNAYILENSYGVSWVTGDVTDWLTISLSSAICDTGTLASQAQEAAKAAGWTPSNYSRWIYAFPRNVCDFGGASYIGGAPSQAWLNGYIDLGFSGHEFGHGLGLWHSRALNCGTVTVGTNCTYQEYGDRFDIMGTPFSGHFNAFQKERLGWVRPDSPATITTVLTSGTYALSPYEPGAPGSKALKILKSTDPTTGKRTWYYVESRQATGFDAFLAGYSNPTSGVILHTGSELSGNSSYLLDMTPETSSGWYDAALVAGQSFSDPDAGVAITTEAVTSTGATVAIVFTAATGTPPTTTASLTEVVTTDQPSYNRNQTVTITSTVTSGGSPVVGASVTFTITKASGSLIVANGTTGADGIAAYKIRLKRQDPLGTYQVGATAKKEAATVNAATQFTVR